MGPYCKFCNNRCFVPTNDGLKATCLKGVFFDAKLKELKELEELHESEITETQQTRLNDLANEIELVRRF